MSILFIFLKQIKLSIECPFMISTTANNNNNTAWWTFIKHFPLCIHDIQRKSYPHFPFLFSFLAILAYFLHYLITVQGGKYI